MSKLKNMAVFSAMLVGVMIYTSPAKSAVCFLPDDDGGVCKCDSKYNAY